VIKLICYKDETHKKWSFTLHADQPVRCEAVHNESGHTVMYVWLGTEADEDQNPIMCFDTEDLKLGERREISWDKPYGLDHDWCEAHAAADRSYPEHPDAHAAAEALADKTKYPPHHQHDCEQCVYLGHASTTHYEGRDNPIGGTPVDLYICQKTRHDHALERFGSIIARYGGAGSYLSYPGFPETEAAARKNPLTREALERAEARGLLGKLRADQKDYITCGELVNLADQGRSVFPIWVGDYEVIGKAVNLLTVLRLEDRTRFYVREYELLGTSTLRYAGEVLAKLDLQAPK
jgi:hypothetical protein